MYVYSWYSRHIKCVCEENFFIWSFSWHNKTFEKWKVNKKFQFSRQHGLCQVGKKGFFSWYWPPKIKRAFHSWTPLLSDIFHSVSTHFTSLFVPFISALRIFFFLNFKCFYTYLSAITKRSSFFVRLEIRKEENKNNKSRGSIVMGKIGRKYLNFHPFLFLACVLFFHPLFLHLIQN